MTDRRPLSVVSTARVWWERTRAATIPQHLSRCKRTVQAAYHLRVFVPRGEEPLYYLTGVIYVRFGPTDIRAQPEMVKRLLAAYAF